MQCEPRIQYGVVSWLHPGLSLPCTRYGAGTGSEGSHYKKLEVKNSEMSKIEQKVKTKQH